jgi:hypothetical protein
MALKKQLSQTEISDWARNLIEALRSGGRLDELTLRFMEELASTRREVMEDIFKMHQKHPSVKLMSEHVLEFMEKASVSGSGQKPDFHEKYYRTLFKCAKALAGEQHGLVTKRLFMRLVQSTAKGETNFPLSFAVFADCDAVVNGMDEALSDDSCHSQLERSFGRWSQLIPELAAKGKEKIGLSKCAVHGLLKVIARIQKIDSSLRLSLPVLVGAADNIPDEFQSSPHSWSERIIRSSSFNTPENQSPDSTENLPLETPANTPETKEAKPEFNSIDISRFSELLHQSLVQLDHSVGEKLKAQAREITRFQEQANELRSLVREKENHISDLVRLKDSIQAQAFQDRTALSVKETELATLQEELSRYSESHDILVATSNTIEQEVASRIKREFSEHIGELMRDIRNYIDKLQVEPSSNTLRLTVSSFNRLARALHNQNYLSVSMLPKIEVINSQGDSE